MQDANLLVTEFTLLLNLPDKQVCCTSQGTIPGREQLTANHQVLFFCTHHARPNRKFCQTCSFNNVLPDIAFLYCISSHILSQCLHQVIEIRIRCTQLLTEILQKPINSFFRTSTSQRSFFCRVTRTYNGLFVSTNKQKTQVMRDTITQNRI